MNYTKQKNPNILEIIQCLVNAKIRIFGSNIIIKNIINEIKTKKYKLLL